MLVAPPLARLALAFSSPEYFALMALGLAMVVLLAGRSLMKALLAMLVGLWIAGIGTDLFSTTSRFTFGRMELLGGHRLRGGRDRRVRDRRGAGVHGGRATSRRAAGAERPAQPPADAGRT